MEQLHSHQTDVDVLIAGAGIAGVLLASRLASLRPDLTILVVESESAPGGRARTHMTGQDAETFLSTYGLGYLSEGLLNFWDQTLKLDPEADDINAFINGRVETFGEMSSGKLSFISLKDLTSVKGARLIGGLAAGRDWADPTTLDPGGKEPAAMTFLELWGKGRKSPASAVIDALAPVVGIPDPWSASAQAFVQRFRSFCASSFSGKWVEAATKTLELASKTGQVRFLGNAHVVQAQQAEGRWIIKTRLGTFSAASLAVAQPPWQALEWLAQSHWNSHVLQLANRTRPSSVVVLGDSMLGTRPENLPDVLWVAAEQVQVVVSADRSVAFQATLEYEYSMDHPMVVKAVRRLKRAKKRLVTMYPGLLSEKDHLALLPVAWAQSSSLSDRRWLEKIDTQNHQSTKLTFVGDSYGASYEGDNNIIKSVSAAAKLLWEKLPRGMEDVEKIPTEAAHFQPQEVALAADAAAAPSA